MDKQRFSKLAENAKLIRSELQEIIDDMAGQVHFRFGVEGISMVSLLPHSPQMGLSKIPKIERFKSQFSELFQKHCRQVEPMRPTPEKELQSFLIIWTIERHVQFHCFRSGVLSMKNYSEGL